MNRHPNAFLPYWIQNRNFITGLKCKCNGTCMSSTISFHFMNGKQFRWFFVQKGSYNICWVQIVIAIYNVERSLWMLHQINWATSHIYLTQTDLRYADVLRLKFISIFVHNEPSYRISSTKFLANHLKAHCTATTVYVLYIYN